MSNYEVVMVETPYDGVKNEYGVAKAQWKKWPSLSRRVFNELYSTMLAQQELFMHPKDTKRDEVYWATTCWNAAWIAADAAKGEKCLKAA